MNFPIKEGCTYGKFLLCTLFYILSQMSRTDDRVPREEYEKLVRELEVVHIF